MAVSSAQVYQRAHRCLPTCFRGQMGPVARSRHHQMLKHAQSYCFRRHKGLIKFDSSMCPQVPYDLLVGADGANSLVRSQLQATMPSGYVRRIRHQGVYTTTGVAVPADELPGHAFFEIHSFEASSASLDETWHHDTVLYLQLSCNRLLLEEDMHIQLGLDTCRPVPGMLWCIYVHVKLVCV